MLEGLDDIAWDRLTHAYGPATDVPQLLRDLAAEDAAVRQNALSALYGNIWHQNTVFAATAHAVPFLVELAASGRVPDRDGVLRLLSAIANGTSYHDVHQHVSFLKEKAGTEKWQAAIREENVWVAAARGAVAAGCSAYGRLLEDPAAEVRAAAAYVLANFVAEMPAARTDLERALAAEREPLAQASLLRALGCARDAGTENVQRFRGMLTPDRHPFTRLSAAMSLAVTLGEEMPAEAVELLKRAIVAPAPSAEELQRRSPWAEGNVRSDASSHLALLGPQAATEVVPLLAQALQGANPLVAVQIVEAALGMVFAEAPAPATARAVDLSADQRAALEAIHGAENAWFWKGAIFANMGSLMRAFGLPGDRDQLGELLRSDLTIAEATALRSAHRNGSPFARLRRWLTRA
jgi:hypothetical protein